MAPLSKAIAVESIGSGKDGAMLYGGNVDPEWNIASVPNGGYILGLVIEACIKHQASTAHPDPIHVTAHFLRAAAVAPFEVQIRTLRVGKGFSNLVADFIQKDQTKLTTHAIFGVLEPLSPTGGPSLTLKPPAPFARRSPLVTHPSRLHAEELFRPLKYARHISLAEDPAIREQNLMKAKGNTKDGYSSGELEWGAWMELLGDGERVTTPALAFLADNCKGLPVLIAEQEQKGIGGSWFPTLTLSIEFKFPIPTGSEYSRRTVGLHSAGRFINDPQGRHNSYVEVWTSPSNIGEGHDTANWRDKQLCLAVVTQTALVVPMAMNLRSGRKEIAKL